MKDKIIIIPKGTFEIIQSAVNKTVDLIKPTYGPASNKVIISKSTHGFVVDDGVQIARDIEFSDPAENAVMKVVRETAIKTNDRVGDGTTGALIIVQALIVEIAKLPHFDGRKIEKELKAGLEECKAQIAKRAIPVKTKADLMNVALISFDDKKIAELVANAWHELGSTGVLTVDRSGTMETVVEMTDGVSINRGYLSPYMITDFQRMEAVIEKPHILFTDYRLTESNDIIGIMNKLAEKQITNLVVIAENVEQSALGTMIINKQQGKFNTIAVNAPIGANKTVILEDIALMTGGRVFSESKGDKLQSVEIADLGRAERFIAKRKESIIVTPKGVKKDISKAFLDLHMAIANEKQDWMRDELKERLARLSNKVGVVKVGAATENETDALKYKVEDAVASTQTAFKGGVLFLQC